MKAFAILIIALTLSIAARAQYVVSTGEPSWIPLDNAKDVETKVRQYQHLVRDSSD